MTESLDPLLRDFVGWLAREPRPYAEAIEAWRTSCPRLTVWEDAAERGFVERRYTDDGVYVFATEAGLAFLREDDRSPAELAQ
ncbi:MAG: hypothetical protein AAGC70_11545 [Pseudomonadota bacterium]